MAALEPLRVAVLGGGRIARRFHLPILTRLPSVAVFAVAEPDPEARDACRSIAPAAALFADYTQLLSASKLDAAVICLPPALHAPAAVACFQRGLHTYVEKPLAISLEQASSVTDAWRQAGATGAMGFNYRFHPLIGELKAQLQRGQIGDVTAVRGSFGGARRTLPDWKRSAASGGGVLLDLAVHHIDLIRYLFDAEIAEVNASLRSAVSEDDTAIVTLRLASGPLASLCVTLAGIEEDRIEVTGAQGQLVFDRYRSSRLLLLPATRDFSRAGRAKNLLAGLRKVPATLHDALLPPSDVTFMRSLAAFCGAARGQPWRGADLSDGLAALKVALAAKRAAQQRATITLT